MPATAALALAAFVAHAQFPLTAAQDRSVAKSNAVEYLYPEQVTVPAGKPSAIEMHFRIAHGLHINSHTPKDDFLIPTVLSVPASSGVRLENATYPPGVDFTLPIDPKTKLSVYTGDFTIFTRIVAQRGNHLVQAQLRYQACDNNACMPPKTVTVPIDVIGQ
ncbi:MAG: disulfide bond formation protein DsbC [Acidobacteriota bacterium]|nr:disulfide bond formation protein DsbC [Acidobacteriota bacterium]